MKRALLTLVLLLAAAPGYSQIIGNYTANKVMGGTLPSTCNPGPPPDVWVDTTGVVPLFYICGSSGMWSTVTPQTVITTARTYYVCAKGLGGSCNYNNAGAVTVNAACPSDMACNGLSPTTPFASIAGAQAAVGNSLLLAVATANLADTAGTGTDCYTPNAVTFSTTPVGYVTAPTYYGDPAGGGGSGLTNNYPTSYFYLHGNDTTPGNVIITGAAACNGTAASTKNLLTFTNGNYRIRGATFNYAASNAVMFLNSMVMLEGVAATNDGGQNEFAFTSFHGYMGFGGTNNCIGYITCLMADGSGSLLDDKTPLGCGTFTLNLAIGSGNISQGMILMQESAKEYVECGTYSFTGNKAVSGWRGQDGGIIMFNDGAPVTVTYNNASLTPYRADLDSVIFGNACPTVGTINNFTCTNTASAAIYAQSNTFSRIYLGTATSGKGQVCSDNAAQKGGLIFINWFGQGPTCGDFTPLTNKSGAVYTAIAGNGAGAGAEQYLASGTDMTIYAGQFNAAGRHLTGYASGIWSTLNNADTLTIQPYFCQTSAACGGTKVAIGAPAAFADGAGGAITNQAWWFQWDCDLLTTGASATASCQGHGFFFNAATTGINVAFANTGVTTFNATVTEFAGLGLTWSNNSATDTIQVRTMKVNIPY